KAYQVKIELEQLSRELTSLSSNSTENEVTRKSITQFKDELEQAFAEYRDLQKRLQSPSTAPAAGAAAGAGAASAEGPRGDRGAEMQPVSQRQMLERQQQQMRDMEEPLSALEGSVNNLQQAGAVLPCRPDRRTGGPDLRGDRRLHSELDPGFFLSQNKKARGKERDPFF
ncbi:unnamed protein product, partial [Effrenium voratum]